MTEELEFLIKKDKVLTILSPIKRDVEQINMKEYLKSWIPRIQNFSLKLDKLSKLYNQPWVLVNDLNDFIKIIFQEGGKLIVSKNGVVSYGGWELV